MLDRLAHFHVLCHAMALTVLNAPLLTGHLIAQQRSSTTSPRPDRVAAIQPPHQSVLRRTTLTIQVPWAEAPVSATGFVSEHSRNGIFLGAIAGGVGLALLGSQLCQRGESCTRTVIGFALIGATIGAVVGGIIESSASHDEGGE